MGQLWLGSGQDRPCGSSFPHKGRGAWGSFEPGSQECPAHPQVRGSLLPSGTGALCTQWCLVHIPGTLSLAHTHGISTVVSSHCLPSGHVLRHDVAPPPLSLKTVEPYGAQGQAAVKTDAGQVKASETAMTSLCLCLPNVRPHLPEPQTSSPCGPPFLPDISCLCSDPLWLVSIVSNQLAMPDGQMHSLEPSSLVQ